MYPNVLHLNARIIIISGRQVITASYTVDQRVPGMSVNGHDTSDKSLNYDKIKLNSISYSLIPPHLMVYLNSNPEQVLETRKQ